MSIESLHPPAHLWAGVQGLHGLGGQGQQQQIPVVAYPNPPAHQPPANPQFLGAHHLHFLGQGQGFGAVLGAQGAHFIPPPIVIPPNPNPHGRKRKSRKQKSRKQKSRKQKSNRR